MVFYIEFRVYFDEFYFWFVLFISYIFILGFLDGGRIVIFFYGVDLEYWFNNCWGVGLYNDIELEIFIVEWENNEFIECCFLIVIILDLLYYFNFGIVFVIGLGLEFDIIE